MECGGVCAGKWSSGGDGGELSLEIGGGLEDATSVLLLCVFDGGGTDLVVGLSGGVLRYWGRKSVVSLFHELTSKTMFIMMMLVAAMLAGNRRASAGTRAVCVAYVVYGIFCVTGYLTEGSWFEPLVLVYESTYIVTFPLVLAACREKVEG